MFSVSMCSTVCGITRTHAAYQKLKLHFTNNDEKIKGVVWPAQCKVLQVNAEMFGAFNEDSYLKADSGAKSIHLLRSSNLIQRNVRTLLDRSPLQNHRL